MLWLKIVLPGFGESFKLQQLKSQEFRPKQDFSLLFLLAELYIMTLVYIFFENLIFLRAISIYIFSDIHKKWWCNFV